MKIGIIFAMKEELDELKKLINIEKIEKIYELTFFYGIIDNKTCIFVESGIGKVNAARTTQILIDKIGVDYIFNIGVAGGISNDLQVGDIVIGEKIVQHDFDITAFNHKKGYIPNVGVYIESDKMLINIASNVITEGVKGVIATGDIFCSENNMAKKIFFAILFSLQKISPVAITPLTPSVITFDAIFISILSLSIYTPTLGI